jgi:imidazolonepropionase-like amidohydrolase
MMKQVLPALVAVALAAVCARANACPSTDQVLAPVHVVDVEAGVVRRERALVISDGRIVAESAASVASGATRTDGRGAYVIPGLWDMHVHALWDASVPEPFFRMFLEAGVTSLRDMGGDLTVAVAARARADGCSAQPHFWFAGPFLDGPQPVDPALSIALRTPQDGQAAVRMLKRQGVDFLKVYSLVPANVFTSILDEAERARLPVAGHLPGGVKVGDRDVRRMASIEHLAIELGGLCAFDDQAACGPTFDVLIQAGVAMTPTLIARETSTRLADADFRPSYEGLPPAVRSYWESSLRTAAGHDDAWWTKRRVSLEHARWMTRELARRNAVLLVASDAGTPFVVPGASLHDELALMVEAGLSPLEALRAATVAPARFVKRADMGRIVPGAVADLVLLSRNPLDDIRNTRRIVGVYVNGRLVTGNR